MKHFTRFCALFVCLFVAAVASAETEKVHANFANAQCPGNAQWDAETNTMTWTETYFNQIGNLGLPSGDITGYEKLVIDCDSLVGGSFRLLVYQQDDSNITLKVTANGVTEFVLSNFLTNDQLTNVKEVKLSGGQEGPGSVIINDLYMETFDGDAPVVDEGGDNLTAAMFLDYTDEANPANGYGAFVLGTATGLPYGDGSVSWKKYADLTAWDRLVVTVISGQPRFCFNRLVDGGQDNEDESQSQMIDIPNKAWGTQRYQTVDGNAYTINLKLMTEEKGFAHLHCIKGANWQDVNIKSLKLFKDGEVETGIQAVKAETNDVWYDLQGRRVAQPTKGLYIHNGKKIIY